MSYFSKEFIECVYSCFRAYFIASAGIPFGPAELLLLKDFMAFLISYLLDVTSVMGMSCSAGGISVVVSGLGLFQSFSKCSFLLNFYLSAKDLSVGIF